MTTIAYKDGIIAYDSRFTCNNVIVDDNGDKKIEADGKVFILTGAQSDFIYLIDSYLHDKLIRKVRDPIRALVVDNGKLYSSAISSHDGFWRCEESLSNHVAIGSGCDFALAFMDTGMTAEEAVRDTCKRDIYTGGTIRTFKIN